MSITPGEFDSLLDKWDEWQSFPWGHLLYSTSHLNLERHTGNRALRVLDVGGGNGRDSIYFAARGHSVTLLDASVAMLDAAKQAAEKQGVSEKIEFYQANADEIAQALRGKRFDLILCHLMIEFVPNSRALLREACKHLVPGGLLSVIDANRYSEAYRIAFQTNDLPNAVKVIGSKTYFHPWVNRDTPRFSAREIIGRLQANGCALVGHYGVLCVCAYLPNEPKFNPKYFAELEQLEHRLTDTYPYYLLARFFQVIVRKNHRRRKRNVTRKTPLPTPPVRRAS